MISAAGEQNPLRRGAEQPMHEDVPRQLEPEAQKQLVGEERQREPGRPWFSLTPINLIVSCEPLSHLCTWFIF